MKLRWIILERISEYRKEPSSTAQTLVIRDGFEDDETKEEIEATRLHIFGGSEFGVELDVSVRQIVEQVEGDNRTGIDDGTQNANGSF